MASTPGQIVGMQQILHKAGFYNGPANGNANDPHFVDALARWQAHYGLVASGRFDVQTQSKVAALLAPNAVTAKDQEEAIKRYGAQYAIYMRQPEIGPLIVRAAKAGKDANWLKAELQKTNYWKQTAAAQRDWETLKITDPGTASARLAGSIAVVRDKLHAVGLSNMSEADVRRLADDRLAYAWDDNNDAIFNDVVAKLLAGQKPQELVGQQGVLMGQLKAAAASQLLALDDATAYKYATRIYSGESSLDAYNVLFRQQAKAKAPYAAQQIDDGVTLADIFDQQKQRVAQTLEVDPDSIDMINNPTWRSITSYADPTTGKVRGMTETEAEILARKQAGFTTTNNANTRGAEVTDFLSREWGVRPTS